MELKLLTHMINIIISFSCCYNTFSSSHDFLLNMCPNIGALNIVMAYQEANRDGTFLAKGLAILINGTANLPVKTPENPLESHIHCLPLHLQHYCYYHPKALFMCPTNFICWICFTLTSNYFCRRKSTTVDL